MFDMSTWSWLKLGVFALLNVLITAILYLQLEMKVSSWAMATIRVLAEEIHLVQTGGFNKADLIQAQIQITSWLKAYPDATPAELTNKMTDIALTIREQRTLAYHATKVSK